MQTESQFLASQIYLLQQRLTTIPKEERPASTKLQKAFEIEQRTIHCLKEELVEMLGRDDAYGMVNEAQTKAQRWFEEVRSKTLRA